jgi:F-type H+-transporting ATPase subunit epsilon
MSDTKVPEPTLQSAVEHSLMPSIVTEMQDELKGHVRCIVVTPEKAVLDATAEMVIVPMYDGELGVLTGRAPLIGRLGAGELRLKTGTAVERWFVEAGFVQVRSNVVTVLTSKAVKAETVTAAMADQARAEAEALPFGNAVERANKAKARDRASGLKKVAGKNALPEARIISPGSHPV